MPLPHRSVSIVSNVAIALLVIGILIAVALLTRVIDPVRGGIEIGEPMAIACEPGDGAPGCYAFTVRNAGRDVASVECLVVPAQGTTSRFVTGQSSVVLTLQPGEERTVRASADPVDGVVVTPPALECGSL